MTKTQTKRILIVDDEPEIIEILKFYFEEADFETHTAFSVDEAIGKIESLEIEDKVPDIILSDVRMPQRTGMDLARWVNGSHFEIPIVFFTGFADVSEEEAARSGVVKILNKPLPAPELIDSVNSCLNR